MKSITKYYGILLMLIVLFQFGLSFVADYNVAKIAALRRLSSSRQSSLYEVYLSQVPGKMYQFPIKLLYLKGSHRDVGFDYGFLLGHRIKEVYTSIIGAAWVEDIQDIMDIPDLENALDWKWSTNYKNHLNPEHQEELAGIKLGGNESNVGVDLENIVTRIVLISNAPGNIKKYLRTIFDEYKDEMNLKNTNNPSSALNNDFLLTANRTSSTFAVWGERTAGNFLFTSHNLNWLKNTGISREKLITIYSTTGKITFLTAGFSGFWGIWHGLSNAGISIHESEAPSSSWKDEGIPWSIQQRTILERSINLDSAVDNWKSNKNTFGFNHLIGSSIDSFKGKGAIVLETNNQFTAKFEDNDPRERDATLNGKKIGYPLSNALWRTNHAYDPSILSKNTIPPDVNSQSFKKYKLIHDILLDYTGSGRMDFRAAINATSLTADKGSTDITKCTLNEQGSNILSTIFSPNMKKIWVSWEDTFFSKWSPAACNIYVEVDLNLVLNHVSQ